MCGVFFLSKQRSEAEADPAEEIVQAAVVGVSTRIAAHSEQLAWNAHALSQEIGVYSEGLVEGTQTREALLLCVIGESDLILTSLLGQVPRLFPAELRRQIVEASRVVGSSYLILRRLLESVECSASGAHSLLRDGILLGLSVTRASK